MNINNSQAMPVVNNSHDIIKNQNKYPSITLDSGLGGKLPESEAEHLKALTVAIIANLISRLQSESNPSQPFSITVI